MTSEKGVVAAGHELTAAAAAEILQDGGNAFDACVAGLFMTFVAEAVFSSPGGGGFLMARRGGSDKFQCSISSPRRHASGARPATSTSTRSTPISGRPSRSSTSALARAPRQAWCQASSPCMRNCAGCRSSAWSSLRCVPRAEASRSSVFQAYLLTVIAPILNATTGAAKIFAPGGTLLKSGETFSNPDLGECIEWLAEHGARLLVDGDVGQAIVKQQHSGRRLSHPGPILPNIAWRGGRPSCGLTTAPSSRSIHHPRQAGR